MSSKGTSSESRFDLALMSDEERDERAKRPMVLPAPTTFKAKRARLIPSTAPIFQNPTGLGLPSDPVAWLFAVVEVEREQKANFGPYYVIFTPATYFRENQRQYPEPVLFAINDHLPPWMGHEIGPGTFILTDIEEMPTSWHTIVQELTRRGFVFNATFAHLAEPRRHER